MSTAAAAAALCQTAPSSARNAANRESEGLLRRAAMRSLRRELQEIDPMTAAGPRAIPTGCSERPLAFALALISDAAHMLTDTAAIAIALVAIRLGRLPPDSRRTFGYQRFEILAAAFNAVLLIAVAIYILYEAYRRLQSPRRSSRSGCS
jgi:hypothetical protein